MRGLALVFPSLAGGVVMGFGALVALGSDALLGGGAFARSKLSALSREQVSNHQTGNIKADNLTLYK